MRYVNGSRLRKCTLSGTYLGMEMGDASSGHKESPEAYGGWLRGFRALSVPVEREAGCRTYGDRHGDARAALRDHGQRSLCEETNRIPLFPLGMLSWRESAPIQT